jgi:hypothetical protein
LDLGIGDLLEVSDNDLKDNVVLSG